MFHQHHLCSVCDSDTHHTHRRQRTIQCTGPGSQPEAWLSLHQHRILNKTKNDDLAEFDPGYSFGEQCCPSVEWRVEQHFVILNPDFVVESKVTTTPICQSCISVPQKEMVARRLLSNGGAHLLQIPWQAGYVTPCTETNDIMFPLWFNCINWTYMRPVLL